MYCVTGPTSNAFHLIGFNETSRQFDFPNSSITVSKSSVMIEIGEKIGGVESCGTEGEGSGQGYFPPQWG